MKKNPIYDPFSITFYFNFTFIMNGNQPNFCMLWKKVSRGSPQFLLTSDFSKIYLSILCENIEKYFVSLFFFRFKKNKCVI